jgi:hypothetical protein
MYVNSSGKLRLKLAHDDGATVDLSVTDIRFYKPPEWDLRQARVDGAIARLEGDNPVILSVGLTRQFKGVHWLQLNNIHFLGR